VGVVTSRDSFVIDEKRVQLSNRINDFFELSKDELITKYRLKENKSWKIDNVKRQAKTYNNENITSVSYRPFDCRFIYYNNHFVERSRTEVMKHFMSDNNIGLALCKQFKTGDTYFHSF